MSFNFQELPGFGTNPFEAITKTTTSTTKGLQAIVAETTDYSKKAFDKSRVLAEKLASVKKIDEAIQLQSDFAKSAFEDFIAQATKIGNLYSDLAKDAFRLTKFAPPVESPVAAPPSKAPVAVKQS